MKRTYLTITQDDIDLEVAKNLRSRELELLSYDFERENHEASIAAMADLEWDETTAPYKGLTRDAMIVRAQADGKDSATIQKIGDLLALDLHRINLEAVIVETTKSERHYETLLTALPEGESRETAMAVVAAAKANRQV